MQTTLCRHCQQPFEHARRGALFCSGTCRVAAHRERARPLPETIWLDRAAQLSTASRSLNSDGTPALSRAELGERLIELAETADDGAPKTGRRFYYLALSHGYIRPDMGFSDAARKSRDAAYKRVTDVLGVLRMNGELGWDAVLDLTRDLDQWQTYHSPREARAAMRRRYDEDRWLGQYFYPVLIVEKDTLEPICQPLARRWQAPFASSRGYGSLKIQHDVARMLNERHAAIGQIPLVLFISDLDPSGLDLQRAWEEALGSFGVACVFERIGLTMEQIGADPNLAALGIAVKPSDSRAKAYIAEYGDICWEADVLPAAIIEAAIDAAIEDRLDRAIWNQRDAEIERARALL